MYTETAKMRRHVDKLLKKAQAATIKNLKARVQSPHHNNSTWRWEERALITGRNNGREEDAEEEEEGEPQHLFPSTHQGEDLFPRERNHYPDNEFHEERTTPNTIEQEEAEERIVSPSQNLKHKQRPSRIVTQKPRASSRLKGRKSY